MLIHSQSNTTRHLSKINKTTSKEFELKITSTCKTSINDLSMRECLSDYEERWRRDPESKVVKARREYCEDLLSERVTTQSLYS